MIKKVKPMVNQVKNLKQKLSIKWSLKCFIMCANRLQKSPLKDLDWDLKVNLIAWEIGLKCETFTDLVFIFKKQSNSWRTSSLAMINSCSKPIILLRTTVKNIGCNCLYNSLWWEQPINQDLRCPNPGKEGTWRQNQNWVPFPFEVNCTHVG